jgi:NitT/TauT family transport system substrate-binding protein
MTPSRASRAPRAPRAPRAGTSGAPRRPRPAAVLLIAGTLVAAALAGCTPATAADPGASAPGTGAPAAGPGLEVTVAAVPAPGAAGLYIAADDGLFARAGLRVTITPAVSASGVLAALTAGRTDVVLGQWTTAIGAEAAGARLAAIGAGNSGGPGLEELVTLPGSPVTRLSQLPGLTVAVNALRGLPQALTQTLLEDHGIPAGRVRFVAVPFPAMAAALRARRADVAFMVEPYLSQAQMSFGVTELADLDQGATQDIPVTGYFTTRRWLSASPAAAAFVRALREGQQIAATSRTAVEQALIRHLGITPEAAAVMSPGSYPTGPVDPVQLARVGDLMRSAGLLPPGTRVRAVALALTS